MVTFSRRAVALYICALLVGIHSRLPEPLKPTGTTSNHARRIAPDYFCATMQAESKQIPPLAPAVLRTGNNAAGVNAEAMRLKNKTSVQSGQQVLA